MSDERQTWTMWRCRDCGLCAISDDEPGSCGCYDASGKGEDWERIDVVAATVLSDLVQEFSELRTEFERLKKTYEPPYVAYASWALPAANRALGTSA